MDINVSVLLHFPEQAVGAASSAIRWCAVGHAETAKCDTWSINSVGDDGSAAIECQNGASVEDCMSKIMVKHDGNMGICHKLGFCAPF